MDIKKEILLLSMDMKQVKASLDQLTLLVKELCDEIKTNNQEKWI